MCFVAAFAKGVDVRMFDEEELVGEGCVGEFLQGLLTMRFGCNVLAIW